MEGLCDDAQGLFVFSSFNVIPKAGFFLQQTSIESAAGLCKIIEARLKTSSGVSDAVTDWFFRGSAYEDSDESERFYRELVKSGLPTNKLAGDCLCVLFLLD